VRLQDEVESGGYSSGIMDNDLIEYYQLLAEKDFKKTNMPLGGDIQDWFKSLPFFTRYWFGGTVLFTLLGRFGILPAHWLILHWEPLWHQFQIWRPITAVFYYPLSPRTGFHFLINLYFMYNYSLRLETGIFSGRPADYAFMLMFLWICAVIIGLLMNIMFLMDPLVLSVLYVWCQLNKVRGCVETFKYFPCIFTIFFPGCHCELLVRITIQSYVPALGPPGLQRRDLGWWRHGAYWYPSWSPLLFPHV